MNFDKKYQEYLTFFNNKLDLFFDKIKKDIPSNIFDGLKYAVLGGGKRIRPILCLSTSEMLGISLEKAVNFAIAVEFIHSYSLVHDDLPAMDNDDFRRGKPSTHKAFGEANAILIGDGLLNLAFDCILDCKNITKNEIDAMKVLSNNAGFFGMVKGQFFDLNKSNINEKTLIDIDVNKTEKLIEASVLMASCLAGKKYYNELKDFSYNLGIMFQFVDDVLDEEGDFVSLGKTLHKDIVEDKLTAIKIYGINKTKEKIKELYLNAIKCIEKIDKNDFLIELTKRLYERKK